MGAHRIERVTKPDCASIVCEKWGSLATSSTRWQRFSRTLRPTMPSETGRRRPVIGCGPTQAWQAISFPSLSTSQREPASASRCAAIIASARSSVVSMSIEIGEVLGHLGEQGEGAGEIAAPQRGIRGLDFAGVGGRGEVAVIRRGVGGVGCEGIGHVRLEVVAVR